MALKIWLDGKLVDEADAKVSVFDHGLLYGDGVFEGIRVYNGKVFELQAHLRRLYGSAKAIRLEVPMDKTELPNAIKKTVEAIRKHLAESFTKLTKVEEKLWKELKDK